MDSDFSNEKKEEFTYQPAVWWRRFFIFYRDGALNRIFRFWITHKYVPHIRIYHVSTHLATAPTNEPEKYLKQQQHPNAMSTLKAAAERWWSTHIPSRLKRSLMYGYEASGKYAFRHRTPLQPMPTDGYTLCNNTHHLYINMRYNGAP